MNRFLNILIIGLIAVGLLSARCQKEDEPLPYAYVNFRIEPNSTLYINLNSPGGYEYITAERPSRGIIVYRVTDMDFVAYERTCPHDPDACCTEESCSRLYVEEGSVFIKDDCCESRYLILDGTNFDGPSNKPLKQYNTTFDGKTLHIFN